MKITAFNGSPRKDGNTSIAIDTVFEEMKDIETNKIHLYDYDLKPCTACVACVKNKDCKCAVDADFNKLYQKMMDSDGIILGSPVYVASVTGQMKLFLDKMAIVSKANNDPLARKVGAGITVGRRAGHLPTLQVMNNALFVCQFIVPGSSYWNMSIAGPKGSVSEDAEGIGIFNRLGQNMAWLLEKLQ